MDVEVAELRGPLQVLVGTEQQRAEAQASLLHAQAQLAQAREDGLLDVAGHSGLLGAPRGRRVRIGIGGEGPVLGHGLLEAQARADAIVVGHQLPPQLGGAVLLRGAADDLLHGQQELGHHVPVDAAQALVSHHDAGTSQVGVVVEDVLEEVQHRLAVAGHGFGPALLSGHASQGGRQVARVAEGGVEGAPQRDGKDRV